jgi:hypothetical protein
VQHSCGREEFYLRQLIQLSPHAAHLGAWLARLLRTAYERDVTVTVRSRDTDVDERSDAALGELLLAVLGDSPPGSSYVLGVFEYGEWQTITVVGPAAILE